MLVSSDVQAKLSHLRISVYLCFWLGFIAFKLNLNPLFLEISQHVIAINFVLFFVECVYNNFNKQICNEQRPEYHIDDKNQLKVVIITDLWFETYPNRICCLVHETYPTFCGAHCEKSYHGAPNVVEIDIWGSPGPWCPVFVQPRTFRFDVY